MTGRRRVAARQARSAEPPDGQVPRQTRGSTRRTETPATEPTAKTRTEIAQRGTRRRRRGSIEGIATDDYPQSPGEYTSNRPDRSSMAPISEPAEPWHTATAALDEDDTDESPETEAARIQDMIDFDIPKFSRWCGSMYNAMVSKSVPPSNPDDRRRLASIRKAYDAARRPFADDKALCIDSFTLSEDHSPEARAAVQITICSGNLVSLLASILDTKLGRNDPLDMFQQLDIAFPTLFDPDYQTHLDDPDVTFDLGFSIRCRRLALSLVANSSADPFVTAASIFCSQRIKTTKKALQALRAGPFREFAKINDEDTISRDAYRARMDELVKVLSSGDRTEALESLNEAYPENGVLERLRLWAEEKFRSLGSDDQESLQALKRPEKADSNIEHEEEGMFVDGNDDASEDSDPGSGTDAEDYDQLVPQSPRAGFIDDSALLAAVKQTEREVSERPTVTDPKAVKGKQKAATAKEEDIRRLDPGEVLSSLHPRNPPSSIAIQNRPQELLSNSQLAPTTDVVAGRVRRRSTEDDNASDGDFEINQQPTNESRRIQYPNALQRLPAKRSRFSSERQPGSLSLMTVNPRQVEERLSLDDDPFADGGLREADLVALSQAAQNSRRTNRVFRPRQIRTPWSIADTERLLELVADPVVGCSWSLMVELGGFETYRTQQALRDKARNLKVLYLQSGMVLPAGFDQVALGQKERDAVIKSGQNPDRTENDLDEDGRVINHIWAAY